MTKNVLVLGAHGRAGKAIAIEFVRSGWNVTGYVRRDAPIAEGVSPVIGKATDVGELKAAMVGVDVVVQALNPPYDKWDTMVHPMNRAVIEAMTGNAATLMLVGNVYNYAKNEVQLLPSTVQRPETPHGRVRKQMEDDLVSFSQTGHQVIVVRAGDFYGPNSVGSVLDAAVIRDLKNSKVSYPSDYGLKHTWAYLPDLGKVFVALAEQSSALPMHHIAHFGGHYVTGTVLVDAIEKAHGKRVKRGMLPWGVLKLIGLFNGEMRKVIEMRYLWGNQSKLVDPDLDALMGEGFGTPLDEALATTISSHAVSATREKVSA